VQPLDLLAGIAERGQDLSRVLPQRGRGERSRRRRVAEMDRVRHPAVAAHPAMLEGGEDALRGHLRVVEHVLDRTGRRARDALAEPRLPLERGVGLQGRAQPGHE
jgi:hypothetical protein